MPRSDTLAPMTEVYADHRRDGDISPPLSPWKASGSALGLDRLRPPGYVAVDGERPDRAILTLTLDLNRRGSSREPALLRDCPGQHATGTGRRSREFVLRCRREWVRAAQRKATEIVATTGFDTNASRRVTADRRPGARAARPLEVSAKDGDRSRTKGKAGEAVAKSQEDLSGKRVARKILEGAATKAEAAGVHDTAWQRQLAEIRSSWTRAPPPAPGKPPPEQALRSQCGTRQDALSLAEAQTHFGKR